jgi:sec-independent protein translocase protein TatC
MTFLEHLEELRTRLIRCLLALIVGTGLCWFIREPLFHELTRPMLAVAKPGTEIIVTSLTEPVMIYMKMSFFAGIFLVSPFLLYQVWAFISPGLYKNEKMYAIPFIGFGSLFFVLGAAFGHFYLIPATSGFLIEFAGNNMKVMPKVGEYFEFYSWFLLGLGVMFQTPVIIGVFARIGLVTPGFLLRHFKYAFLLAFIVAAVLTPTPDMVTQTMLAAPMLVLYLLGVLVAWIVWRPRQAPAPAASTPA